MRKDILQLLFISIGAWCASLSVVYARSKQRIPDSLQVLHFQVGEVDFTMQRIEAGAFIMGGTPEQHREKMASDLPMHTVSLDAYYMASTEVTEALWKAVMPEWFISDEWNTPNMPMTDVSWYDCQRFVERLDSMTGLPFRLPTEAEWEFAARGGNKSKGYRFAGGNKTDSISWGLLNAGFRKHNVALKQPNELGLYDMTGNVSEWCSDWFGPYYLGTEPNPQGPKEGSMKIVRGSSYDNGQTNSYLSRRDYYAPQEAMNYCGLRLALSLPNDPSKQVIEEPAIVKRVKIRNMRIRLRYVAAEEPYYISEEAIDERVWKKVYSLPAGDTWSQPVVDKTDSEWNTFLEICRKFSEAPLCFATREEVEQAIAMGVTHEPMMKKKKQHAWEKDARSKQRRRQHVDKAQKWADLIGVKLKNAEDPTLEMYNKQKTDPEARWLVIR